MEQSIESIREELTMAIEALLLVKQDDESAIKRELVNRVQDKLHKLTYRLNRDD